MSNLVKVYIIWLLVESYTLEISGGAHKCKDIDYDHAIMPPLK